ncbi:unnamed protein product, partial [Rotaria magnacalcarata]
MLARILLTTNL